MTDPYRDYFLATREIAHAGDTLPDGGSFDPPKKRRLRAKLEAAYAEAEKLEQLRESCPFASGQIELEGGYQPDPGWGY